MNKKLKGSSAILLATVIWGAAFVAQSAGMEHIGPFTFQAVRCFLAVIALIPVIAVADILKKDGQTFLSRWKNKKLWKIGILCGIPLFLACNLQQVGLVDVDAGKSGFLTAMYIVIVPIFGLFSKKKPSILIPFSVLLAVCGLYFLSCMGVAQIALGDILLLGCAFMLAVQIFFVDKFATDLDPIRLNLIQALVCAVLSAIIMVFAETPTISSVMDCWLPLCYTGILSMGAGYALQIVGQRHLDSSPAALIMSLESVFAVLFGWLIRHEELSSWECLGCALIFFAVIISQIPVKRRSKA